MHVIIHDLKLDAILTKTEGIQVLRRVLPITLLPVSRVAKEFRLFRGQKCSTFDGWERVN